MAMKFERKVPVSTKNVTKLRFLNNNDFVVHLIFDFDFLEQVKIGPHQSVEFCFCNKKFVRFLKSRNGFDKKMTSVKCTEPIVKDIDLDLQLKNPVVRFYHAGNGRYLIKHVTNVPSLQEFCLATIDENMPFEKLPDVFLNWINDTSYRTENFIYSLSEAFREPVSQNYDGFVRACICKHSKKSCDTLSLR